MTYSVRNILAYKETNRHKSKTKQSKAKQNRTTTNQKQTSKQASWEKQNKTKQNKEKTVNKIYHTSLFVFKRKESNTLSFVIFGRQIILISLDRP